MESNRIEYKSKYKDNTLKDVVAFLNYAGGGSICIGIDKHGTAVGVDDADNLQLLIKDQLRNNILPSCLGLFDIVLEEREGKHILRIIVAGGQEQPYYLKKYGLSEKGAFIRSGSAAEPMSAKMIEILFAKRTGHSIGKIKSLRQDLSFEQLRIYYDAAGKALNGQFAKNLELFNEDGHYNLVACLMGDNNTISIKTAKYAGADRVDLIENNEHGFCSLIKATKAILDKVELENKTLTRITSRERQDKRLWNAVALREAVINAMVHNDYTRELAPKIEFFNDRMEITSYGSLPEGLSREDFFTGISMPRNKELMRIYRDLDMVEQFGSGVPRILQAYGEDCFHFYESYTRMVFPAEEKTGHGGVNELESLIIRKPGINAREIRAELN